MNKDLVWLITIAVGIISLLLCGSAVIMAFKGLINVFGWFLIGGIGLPVAWGAVLYDQGLLR